MFWPMMEAKLMSWIGEMILEIPSFLNVNHDSVTQKATLSVLDAEQPSQRAMWGAYLPSLGPRQCPF